MTRANESTMSRLLRLAERGKLTPAVTARCPLEEVTAHRLLDSAAHIGEFVLTKTWPACKAGTEYALRAVLTTVV